MGRRKEHLGEKSRSSGDTHEITVPNGPACGTTFGHELRTAIRTISRYVWGRQHQHTRSVVEQCIALNRELVVDIETHKELEQNLACR